jgi:predicted RNA-binding Zn-ribbon protein involved in translation (DUF1610 family)
MQGSKRNLWLGIIAAVVLAFAGYRLLFGGSKKVVIPDEFAGSGVCLACGEEALVVFKRGQSQPFRCEACGQEAVYLWWFCNDCGYRFIPELIREPGKLPYPTPYPVCTHCNCNNITGWDADNPNMAPEGDAPLPEWP